MQQCPICYSELEIRQCSPCDCCGADENELIHLKENKHKYNVYEIYYGLKLKLCTFCEVDFSSYKTEYFGFSNKKRLSLNDFNFIKEIENPVVEIDKYCPECKERLSFLKFTKAIWEINSIKEQ
ncbi:MAG: hypothetical protein U0U67_17205 [Chitinophagales bacterium]